MPRKRRRGRPPTFTRKDRAYLAELIREHGISGTRRLARFAISNSTLIKIAREENIVLRKGRRPRIAA